MKRKGWLLVHWAIIINFLLEIFYGSWQTFTLTPSGKPHILFGMAAKIPFETQVVRRLYALETWIAIAGLSLYLALTEILPNLNKKE